MGERGERPSERAQGKVCADMNMLEAPPGILDLIPWQPCPDEHHVEASDLQPSLWSQLPEDVLHSVLARLPFQSILRFRSVCQQWKALFSSPMFYHFASHASHIPPWIFFAGLTCKRRLPYSNEEVDAETSYDDGHDDKGYVFEGSDYGDSDHDSSDSSCTYASDDPGDAHDAMQHGEHWDIYGITRSGDHGDADARGDEHMNDSEACEELFLIFDCASESWRPPLAMPPGFNWQFPQKIFSRHAVCSFQEYVLIPTCYDTNRFFLFNPAAPLCKELPPCMAVQELEGLGLSEEMATLSRSGSLSNSTDLPSLLNEHRSVKQFVQDTIAKILHVVVVGETGKGTYVVESFNSMTGSWRICGYLPSESDNLYFVQKKMVFYKGSFYAITTNGILKLDNLLGGQSLEFTFRHIPIVPNDDDVRDVCLIESRLVATKDSIFMVGVTFTYAPHSQRIEEWDILIWQYLPHCSEDVCWQFLAFVPKVILENYFGDIQVATIDCLAYGDLIIFHIPNVQRLLIYDVQKKLWRFSAKCKWFLDSMIFLWEPVLRN